MLISSLTRDFTWIGWPGKLQSQKFKLNGENDADLMDFVGFDVPEIDRELITRRLQTEFSCIPVYLSAEVAERYYNGFSNSILWPLFHCKYSSQPVESLLMSIQIIQERSRSMKRTG